MADESNQPPWRDEPPANLDGAGPSTDGQTPGLAVTPAAVSRSRGKHFVANMSMYSPPLLSWALVVGTHFCELTLINIPLYSLGAQVQRHAQGEVLRTA